MILWVPMRSSTIPKLKFFDIKEKISNETSENFLMSVSCINASACFAI
jgi:hypothetical protein